MLTSERSGEAQTPVRVALFHLQAPVPRFRIIRFKETPWLGARSHTRGTPPGACPLPARGMIHNPRTPRSMSGPRAMPRHGPGIRKCQDREMTDREPLPGRSDWKSMHQSWKTANAVRDRGFLESRAARRETVGGHSHPSAAMMPADRGFCEQKSEPGPPRPNHLVPGVHREGDPG